MVEPNGRQRLSSKLRRLKAESGNRISNKQIVDLANQIIADDARERAELNRRRRGPNAKPLPSDGSHPELIGSRRAVDGWLNQGKVPTWDHLWAAVRAIHRLSGTTVPLDLPAWRRLYRDAAATPFRDSEPEAHIDQDVHDTGDDSRLELCSVDSLSETDAQGGFSAVLDLKFRNAGGKSAFLHRATVTVARAATIAPQCMLWFRPYEELPVFGYVGPSHTYDVKLPFPERADGSEHTVSLSQGLAAGEVDRFFLRLTIPGGSAPAGFAYLLQLDIHYDADRRLSASPIAIVIGPDKNLATIEDIRRDLYEFHDAVRQVRHAIDKEMTARGLPAPDWRNHPPTGRADLPANLLSVDGNEAAQFGIPLAGAYAVNEAFWDPEKSLAKHLDDIRAYYTNIVELITRADIRHDSLPRILTQAKTVLAQLPALHTHTDLGMPEKAITVQEPAHSGNPDATDELVRLLGERYLEELRERADAGDQGAARRLVTAAGLAEKIRPLGPDHPDTLNAREAPVLWRIQDGDMASAKVALAELIPDQVQVYGRGHPRTLRARHLLAKCHGETGAADAAEAAFAELVPDLEQALGPDHPDTLDGRHELARWRAMAGNAAGAVEAYTELVEDRIRIQGPDHPKTLYARTNLAVCRGKAGDAAGAAAALAELVREWTRVQGADHPDTLHSQRELAYWQDQSGPENT
ncbi:tetratricopeptide repeat protein [Nocardia vinacea]|uniref:tetratricopeptide repeat protein n=1 Tax=Nocardia vinacea TaxID=96468 RepID=UPI0033E20258